MVQCRALALLFAALAVPAAALQFDLESQRTKCLGEVMGKHEIAKGTFKVDGMQDGMTSGLEVSIVGPNGEKEYNQNDAVSGKFAFTATDAGAHKVCFINHGSMPRRISFDFFSGVDAKDYTEIAKKEHLQPLELELRKLEDRIDAIHREMMYQREREEAHRNTNESTNARVVWYSIATIVVVVVVSVAQAGNLYTWLKKRGVLGGEAKRGGYKW